MLTDASIHGKSDHLVGLKENVILGKLIPVGTGLERYRDIRVEPTAEAKANSFQVNYDPFDYDFRVRFGRRSAVGRSGLRRPALIHAMLNPRR